MGCQRLHGAFGALVLLWADFGAMPTYAETVEACFEEWLPFIEQTGDGATGPTAEAVRTALEHAGHTVSFTAMPFARCVVETQAGRTDIALTVGESSSLDLGRHPLAFWSTGAVVREHDSIDAFRDMDQFDGRRVLLTKPFSYPDAIMRHREDWASVQRIALNASDGLQDYTRPFKMLEIGRADVFLDDSFWAARIIRKSDIAVRLLQPPVFVQPTYAGYAPGREALRDALGAEFGRLRDDGTLDRLYEDALGKSWTRLASDATPATAAPGEGD
jgi:ABC-type amino acid transport substrate-binding protein